MSCVIEIYLTRGTCDCVCVCVCVCSSFPFSLSLCLLITDNQLHLILGAELMIDPQAGGVGSFPPGCSPLLRRCVEESGAGSKKKSACRTWAQEHQKRAELSWTRRCDLMTTPSNDFFIADRCGAPLTRQKERGGTEGYMEGWRSAPLLTLESGLAQRAKDERTYCALIHLGFGLCSDGGFKETLGLDSFNPSFIHCF